MLDQNTDRMWYVIGALVVGAGIILLANKTMPEIFASVGEGFENVLSKGSEGAALVVEPRENHVLDSYAARRVNNSGQIDYYLDEGIYDVMTGNTFTVSFDARALVDGKHTIDTYFSLNPMGGTSIKTSTKSDKLYLTEEWQRFSMQLRADELTYVPGHAYSLRFRGNTPLDKNNEHGYETRRVKVELGSNDTGYIPHEDEGIGNE